MRIILQIPDSGASIKPLAGAKPRRGKSDLKITETQVRYVADLANLSLSEEEIARMVHHLGGILEHMDRLAEIDTDGVAPMTGFLAGDAETETLRPDVERPPLENQVALANAPLAAAGYFKVPKVIERS
jgi:aspartyl-tRNA(Asn)/glutamyl-tRNA(Gln) amidotransferase subunit C